MNKVKRKKGKSPQQVEEVEVVPVGMQRIMELQEQDNAYIRP
jgi:intracellular sulfur oxidation DsrE/DsrF family protein